MASPLAICAGEFRHRVDVQSKTEGRDAHGGFTESWSTDATRWAMVKPLVGREFTESNQTDARVTHRVTMRFYDGLTEDMRLLFGARVFGITSVRNIDERDALTVVMCLEDTTNPGD
jgi:SPP1 family predicted phage head-tail adaptor